MHARPITVLLVEDSPGDARLIEVMLSEARAPSFAVEIVKALAPAMERVGQPGVDVIVLDLTLPDSAGFDTFERMKAVASRIPIVVNTGLADEELGIKAMRQGAQDYLVKGQSDGPLLSRALRYAVERATLQGELEQSRQRERELAEIRGLESLASKADAENGSARGPTTALSVTAPAKFRQFVNVYGGLLDRSLEAQVHAGVKSVAEDLRTLAEELAALGAGPRDVIELHTRALKACSQAAAAKKLDAYINEGRMLVLELMGRLTDLYRRAVPRHAERTHV